MGDFFLLSDSEESGPATPQGSFCNSPGGESLPPDSFFTLDDDPPSDPHYRPGGLGSDDDFTLVSSARGTGPRLPDPFECFDEPPPQQPRQSGFLNQPAADVPSGEAPQPRKDRLLNFGSHPAPAEADAPPPKKTRLLKLGGATGPAPEPLGEGGVMDMAGPGDQAAGERAQDASPKKPRLLHLGGTTRAQIQEAIDDPPPPRNSRLLNLTAAAKPQVADPIDEAPPPRMPRLLNPLAVTKPQIADPIASVIDAATGEVPPPRKPRLPGTTNPQITDLIVDVIGDNPDDHPPPKKTRLLNLGGGAKPQTTDPVDNVETKAEAPPPKKRRLLDPSAVAKPQIADPIADVVDAVTDEVPPPRKPEATGDASTHPKKGLLDDTAEPDLDRPIAAPPEPPSEDRTESDATLCEEISDDFVDSGRRDGSGKVLVTEARNVISDYQRLPPRRLPPPKSCLPSDLPFVLGDRLTQEAMGNLGLRRDDLFLPRDADLDAYSYDPALRDRARARLTERVNRLVGQIAAEIERLRGLPPSPAVSDSEPEQDESPTATVGDARRKREVEMALLNFIREERAAQEWRRAEARERQRMERLREEQLKRQREAKEHALKFAQECRAIKRKMQREEVARRNEIQAFTKADLKKKEDARQQALNDVRERFREQAKKADAAREEWLRQRNSGLEAERGSVIAKAMDREKRAQSLLDGRQRDRSAARSANAVEEQLKRRERELQMLKRARKQKAQNEKKQNELEARARKAEKEKAARARRIEEQRKQNLRLAVEKSKMNEELAELMKNPRMDRKLLSRYAEKYQIDLQELEGRVQA
jgi:hypothetical protein